MSDTSYEVVVCLAVSVGGMEQGRWYLESAHPTYSEAWFTYQELMERWPDKRLVLAIVRSVYREDTRLFHDRIVEARARPAMFTRAHVARLTPEERLLLNRYFSRNTSAPQDALAPPPTSGKLPALPGRRVVAWVLAGGGLLAVLLGVLLLR